MDYFAEDFLSVIDKKKSSVTGGRLELVPFEIAPGIFAMDRKSAFVMVNENNLSEDNLYISRLEDYEEIKSIILNESGFLNQEDFHRIEKHFSPINMGIRESHTDFEIYRKLQEPYHRDRLFEKTGIPITTTVLGLGIFPEDHPSSLRMLGMHGTVYANYSVQKSDVLIAVGARFDDRVTGHVAKFCPNAKIIHIDIDPASISKTVRVDVSVVGDVKPVLKQLNKLVKDRRKDIKPWLDQIAEWKAKHPLKVKSSDNVLRQEHVIAKIGELTKHEAVVTTGVGQHQMWTAQWYGFKAPRSMLTSGGLGTMGYGLPSAIGAQLARPNETVICIDGDGSVQMTMCELATAAYYKIPVKLFILDNSHHGMVRQWQEMFYRHRYSGSQLGASNPNFMKLADGYGVKAIEIRTHEELVPGIKEALAHKGPVLVHCVVSQEENVFPMVPAGHALDQVMDMA